MVVPSGIVPPTRPRCTCMTATTGAQHGLGTSDRAHPAHAGGSKAIGECLAGVVAVAVAAAVAPVPTAPRYSSTSTRPAAGRYPPGHLRGGDAGWQAGQGRSACRPPQGAVNPLHPSSPQPRAIPSNWWFGAQDPPAPRLSPPRPVKPWKALPGPTPCTSLGQPPGGLVDILPGVPSYP